MEVTMENTSPGKVVSVTVDGNGSDLDLANGRSESNIKTLEPFSPLVLAAPSALPQRNKRVNTIGKANGKKKVSETLPGIFENISYDKYLTIKLDNTESDMFEID